MWIETVTVFCVVAGLTSPQSQSVPVINSVSGLTTLQPMQFPQSSSLTQLTTAHISQQPFTQSHSKDKLFCNRQCRKYQILNIKTHIALVFFFKCTLPNKKLASFPIHLGTLQWTPAPSHIWAPASRSDSPLYSLFTLCLTFTSSLLQKFFEKRNLNERGKLWAKAREISVMEQSRRERGLTVTCQWPIYRLWLNTMANQCSRIHSSVLQMQVWNALYFYMFQYRHIAVGILTTLPMP